MFVLQAARALGILLIGCMVAFTLPGDTGDELDHRDDLKMNSISGGDFRSYISENIEEDDLWAHSMRTFGTFHNHMHEMMTDLARYDEGEQNESGRVPEFENRISGGEWTEYREQLEADGEESAWRDFVQVTEIMHDRVHHGMYKSTVYDKQSRNRDVDLNEYIGEDRAPHAPGEAIPEPGEMRTEEVSRDGFRELVWHYDFENEHLHAAMQKMLVFDEMLYGLLNDWARYGGQKEAGQCHPPEFGDKISASDWQAYARQIGDCPDEEWNRFVQVAALMHDRIHQMMYQMMLYDAEARDRHDEVQSLMDA